MIYVSAPQPFRGSYWKRRPSLVATVMRPFTSAFRPTLRLSIGHRFASTGTEAAQKKAQDALGSLQKTAEKAWDSAKTFLGPVGEKAGNMLGGE